MLILKFTLFFSKYSYTQISVRHSEMQKFYIPIFTLTFLRPIEYYQPKVNNDNR